MVTGIPRDDPLVENDRGGIPIAMTVLAAYPDTRYAAPVFARALEAAEDSNLSAYAPPAQQAAISRLAMAFATQAAAVGVGFDVDDEPLAHRCVQRGVSRGKRTLQSRVLAPGPRRWDCYRRDTSTRGGPIRSTRPSCPGCPRGNGPICANCHIPLRPGTRTLSATMRARTIGRYLRRLNHALRGTSGPICCFGIRAQTAVALLPPQHRPVGWVVHEIVPDGPYGRLWGLAARRAKTAWAYSTVAGRQPLLRKRTVQVCAVRLDLERFLALPPPKWPIRTIGLIGDLFPLKNHLGFIEVIRCLRARDEPVAGLMVGRTSSASPAHRSYAQRVASAAAEVGQVDVVEATPEEIPGLLTEMDVVLQLSTAPESFGRVCVEALAAGRPVIGFDHGGVAEILSGLNGPARLCPPGDLRAVEAAFINLASSRSDFEAGFEQARHHALRHFGPEQHGATVGDQLVRFALDE